MTTEARAAGALPQWLAGLLSGSVFAAGLSLSGMSDPGKVLGFLDFTGAWDPTLAFVLGGAVGLHFLWLRVVASPSERGSRATSSVGARGIDRRLVGGAALFGVGWGLSGYCPGPGLVAAAYGRGEALVFAAAMVVGVALFRAIQRATRVSSKQVAEV